MAGMLAKALSAFNITTVTQKEQQHRQQEQQEQEITHEQQLQTGKTRPIRRPSIACQDSSDSFEDAVAYRVRSSGIPGVYNPSEIQKKITISLYSILDQYDCSSEDHLRREKEQGLEQLQHLKRQLLLRDLHNQRHQQDMHPVRRSTVTTMYHPIKSKDAVKLYRGGSTSRPSSRDVIQRGQSLQCQRRRHSLPEKVGNVQEATPQQRQQQNMHPARRLSVAPMALSVKTKDPFAGYRGGSTSRTSDRDVIQRPQSLPDKLDYVQDTHGRKQCQRRHNSLPEKFGNVQEATSQQNQQWQQHPKQHQPKQQLPMQQQNFSSWYSHRSSSESPHPL
jgi:hypothetical protein